MEQVSKCYTNALNTSFGRCPWVDKDLLGTLKKGGKDKGMGRSGAQTDQLVVTVDAAPIPIERGKVQERAEGLSDWGKKRKLLGGEKEERIFKHKTPVGRAGLREEGWMTLRRAFLLLSEEKKRPD